MTATDNAKLIIMLPSLMIIEYFKNKNGLLFRILFILIPINLSFSIPTMRKSRAVYYLIGNKLSISGPLSMAKVGIRKMLCPLGGSMLLRGNIDLDLEEFPYNTIRTLLVFCSIRILWSSTQKLNTIS
jgi:hypothetical protein